MMRKTAPRLKSSRSFKYAQGCFEEIIRIKIPKITRRHALRNGETLSLPKNITKHKVVICFDKISHRPKKTTRTH